MALTFLSTIGGAFYNTHNLVLLLDDAALRGGGWGRSRPNSFSETGQLIGEKFSNGLDVPESDSPWRHAQYRPSS